MILDRVTITGADCSVSPRDLAALSEEFPFVEWGILVSASQGTAEKNHVFVPRFPDKEWIEDLKKVAAQNPMQLSMHICGRWVRQLLLGKVDLPEWLIHGPAFRRIQLNFHAEDTPCNPQEFYISLLSLGHRQYIFQIDGVVGNKHLESVYAENDDKFIIDAVPLFDVSGGAGTLPKEWPKPCYMANDVDYVYHGYAGGLGPDNLETQLPLIAEVAGNARIWVDMETKVRSEDDKQFDLGKVRKCLEICRPWIENEKI